MQAAMQGGICFSLRSKSDVQLDKLRNKTLGQLLDQPELNVRGS